MFIKQNRVNGKKSKNLNDFDKNLEFLNESNLNYKDHYHLRETTTPINIMSGIKSLVCDFNGIIIAEMVYRCMICDVIYETIPEIQIHYQTKHIDQDIQNTSINHTNHSNCSSIPKSIPTNVSFFGSLQSTNDPNWDNIVDSSTPHTLTFDVPSGLKTLHKQFETAVKDTPPHKKKSNKPLTTTGNPKAKPGFNKSKVLGQTSGSSIKSSFITCEICGATKFYKYSQRRFGVYSCVGCAKFYTKYLVKPVQYTCENLGKCNLKVSECVPNGRCKACLIYKCKSKFIIDSKKLSNYSKMNSILSQNVNKKMLNDIKTKTNTKFMNWKDSNRNVKSKTGFNQMFESKSKNALTYTKSESESQVSILNKANTLSLDRKSKSDKSVNKNTNNKNDQQIKKTGPQMTGLNKTSVNKPSVSTRMRRMNVKSSNDKSMEKRTRSQSYGKDIKNCDKKLINKRVTEKDKMHPKLMKKNYCLTRSRNK